MRSEVLAKCIACGSESIPLHSKQSDRMGNAPGSWKLVECSSKDCGLVWLNPMPIVEDLGLAYEDYYTHSPPGMPQHSLLRKIYFAIKDSYLQQKYGYSVGPVRSMAKVLSPLLYLFPYQRIKVDFEVFYLDSQPGKRLLEVGFGNGVMLRGLQRLGWSVEGVDFDALTVEQARQTGLSARLGDLEHQAYESCSFDVVAMSHVFEHVPNPLALLQECYRILKPGGRLILITPNTASLGHWIYGRNWMHLDPPRHLYLFNVNNASAYANKAGFSILKARTSIRCANYLHIASRSVVRTSRFTMDGNVTFMEKMFGFGMQTLSGLWVLIRKSSGEELVLICKKSSFHIEVLSNN